MGAADAPATALDGAALTRLARVLLRLVSCRPDLGLYNAAPAVISPRQLECAYGALLAGDTNEALAARLGISVKTVEAHLDAVAERCGLHGRREWRRLVAADYWREVGRDEALALGADTDG